MFKVNNFWDNEDVTILHSQGAFTILQFNKDLSLMPYEVELAHYCNSMDIRRKQVICELKSSDVCIQSKTVHWHIGIVKLLADFPKIGGYSVKPEFTGEGLITLIPTFRFPIIISMSDWESGVMLDDSLFLACERRVVRRMTLCRRLPAVSESKYGIYNICLSGEGFAVIDSPCPEEELVEIILDDDEVTIESTLVVAWSATLECIPEYSTIISSENTVYTYRGKGRVLMLPYNGTYYHSSYL